MPAIFDNCPACQTPTTVESHKRGSVRDAYDACPTSRCWHRILLAAAITAGSFAIVAAVRPSWRWENPLALNAVGIFFTIVGGYLMFGKLELLLLIGRTLGGYHDPANMAALAEQTRRARIGLLLLILGLLVQAWS